MKKFTANMAAKILVGISCVFGGFFVLNALLPTPTTLAVEQNNPTSGDRVTLPGLTQPEVSGETVPNPTKPEVSGETVANPTKPKPSETTVPSPIGDDVITNPDEYEPGVSGEHVASPIDPATPDPGEETEEEETESDGKTVCEKQTGALSWFLCPATEVISWAVDKIYSLINDFLVVEPLQSADDSPIYIVWQYSRDLTNIVFVIFLLIVIYSQITGLGINNYGVKRILPRLIVAVMMVNLSFYICTIAVDASNILGGSLRGFFTQIKDDMLAAAAPISGAADISLAGIVGALVGGGAIAGVVIGAAAGAGGTLFWMVVILLIGGLVSVVTGLITIALRQAMVSLLVMIAPLAFVTYLLPNTNIWYVRWKNALTRMLVFYPIFSFLYGASELAGWAIIASSTSSTGIVIGLAVEIFPIFGSWSLMKMSGTLLGSINAGLRRLAAPLQRSATSWAAEHAEESRQYYFAHSNTSGARLRRYLDTRRVMREVDTQNSKDVRVGKATQQAYTRLASITGRDAKGNMTWEKTPNRYTRNAKTASYYSTLANTAKSAYQNTLTGYGGRFSDKQAQRLSDNHGEAFLDSMAQQFLATNEAQADQEFLLNRYLEATTSQNKNRYEYNRLIKGSAGGLGHLGESSIMGQVIVNNSMIENRRRSEARIIMTKFGIDKTQFRAMLFNKKHINDNGFETDENGNVIEDDQYRLITHDINGNPTNYRHQEWDKYIWVHKRNHKELSKSDYDNLSDAEKSSYKKVRYFDIPGDDKKPVQRVYEDDAGYMKELLRDDIAIGDPINRRYLTEIGVAHREGEKTGEFRRYHSTISAAMLETGYKEHAAEVTPMITAQANAGYITSIGQYNIANLQSLSVASKAGSFLQNDAYAFNNWSELVQCTFDQVKFDKYFPEDAIRGYRNVNGVHLDGLRWDDKLKEWIEINHNDASLTIEDQKNFIKHKIIPKAASKLVGMLNRDISPAVLDSMKPDNLKALKNLLNTLAEVGVQNFDDSLDEDARLQGDFNIFDNSDPKALKSQVQATQAFIDELLSKKNGGSSDNSDDDDSVPDKLTAEYIQRAGIRILSERQQRAKKAQNDKETRNSIPNIRKIVGDVCSLGVLTSATAGETLKDYFANNDRLKNDPVFQAQAQNILDKYTNPLNPPTDEFTAMTNMHQELDSLFDLYFK